jgi:hypothetical protein
VLPASSPRIAVCRVYCALWNLLVVLSIIVFSILVNVAVLISVPLFCSFIGRRHIVGRVPAT